MKTQIASIFLERPMENLDWVLYILLGVMVLIAFGSVVFSNNYASIGNFSRFEDVNDNQALFGSLFQLSFAVLTGTILLNYLTNDYDYIFHTEVLKVLAVAFFILLYFILRSIMGGVAAYAFGINYDRNYNLKVNNYFRVYMVTALWIAVLLLYFTDLNEYAILIGLAVVLLLIKLVNYRYLFKNQEQKQSKIWYYNILYLCALEILPLLVLFKFLNLW